MNLKSKNVGIVVSTLLSTAALSAVTLSTALFSTSALSAEAMLSTGGYYQQIQTMDLMKMLDADNNHMVTLAEFDRFNTSTFEEIDANHDGILDAKEWVGKTIGKQEISVATGGYSRELRKMKMMELMDSDGDHTVTKAEFLKHQRKIFSLRDTSNNQELNAQEWVAELVGGK